MIGKSTTGGGFKGVLNYVTGKENAEILDQQNLWGSPQEWANQMRTVANSKNLKSPVFHASLSLPKSERGTDEQWKEAAKAYLKSMGFDPEKTQYALIRHKDTQHDHVHIVANRVMLDNTVMKDFQHKKRTHEATRSAELAAGFQVNPAKLEHGKVKDLRQSIDESLNKSGGRFDRFAIELAERGITIKANVAKTGHISGLSFKDQSGRVFKGSEIGKNYSLGSLKNRGLQVEQSTRHLHVDHASLFSKISKTLVNKQRPVTDAKSRAESERWLAERKSAQIESEALADEQEWLAKKAEDELE